MRHMTRKAMYKKKICIVTTLWSSINNWIKPFLPVYNDADIDVTIVCNMDSEYEMSLKKEFPFIHTHIIEFPRGVSFLKSIKSIIHLWKFCRYQHFDMVQYSTPNASLYAALATKWARIPVRLYCQWGMIFVTQKGIIRQIFKIIERIVCYYSTNIQPDSFGNLHFCRKIGLYDAKKSEVIWNGSAKGIDLSIFNVRKKEKYALEIKSQYKLTNEPIIGFVGRLGREKGCNELIRAYQALKRDFPRLKMLFVGPIEKESSIDPDLLDYFRLESDIIKTGRVNHVERYISAMDIFILPSYREGFGMSVVEASAMEVPVIATEYPGPSSAMLDGITGYAIEVGNVDDIVKHTKLLLTDKDKARKLGANGRKFAEENFNASIFKQKYIENRMKLLNTKNKK